MIQERSCQHAEPRICVKCHEAAIRNERAACEKIVMDAADEFSDPLIREALEQVATQIGARIA